MKSIRRKAIAFVAVGVLLGTACSAGNEPAGDEGQTLTLATPSSLASINLGKGDGASAITEVAGVVETLVVVDFDLDLQPKLATAWERTGETTWRFTLREGVTFHDGSPFDAEAVKWCLDNSLENNPALSALVPVTSITVIDPQTVEFETEYPTGELPQGLTNVSAAIYAKSSVNEAGEFEKVVGTGYYQQDAYDVASTRYESTVYDGYWQDVDTNIERRVVITMPDPNTRSLAVQNGEVDVTFDVPFADYQGLQGVDGIVSKAVETPRAYRVTYNLKNPALQDASVRKALIHAVNRTELVEDALLGVGGVASGMLPDSVPWKNTDAADYDFDPELAKSMLAEAGYTDTDGDGYVDKDGQKLELKLLTQTLRPGTSLILQAMQGYFENIGVATTADILELSAADEKLKQGDYDLVIASGAINYVPSPCYYLNANYRSSSSTAKNANYSNPELDLLIDECNAENDIDIKTELSKQAQALAQDDVDSYTVANYASVYVYSDQLQGLTFHPAAHDFLVPLDLKKA